MTTVLWPWVPMDDDLEIIIALHPDADVVPYNGEMVETDELSLVQLIKESPGALVYAPNSAVAVVAAVLANLPIRIIELDDEGEAAFVYEFLPKPKSAESQSGTQLTRIWPVTRIADKIKSLQPH